MTVWLRREKISERRREPFYKAYVQPVLTYNAGTWGLTGTQLKKLSAFHRKQLRFLLGFFYPRRISNAAHYRRTGTHPISELVQSARTRLLGHILRLDTDTPAYRAMYAFVACDSTGFRGRPRTSLATTIQAELKRKGLRLSTAADLERLRERASDRDLWRTMWTPSERRSVD